MTSLKLFVLVVCLVGYATAQSGSGLDLAADSVVPFAKKALDVMVLKILLLEYNNVPTKEGYRFNYKTSDGTYCQEVGILMNPGTDKEELVVMGSYSYTSGNFMTTTMYIADKNGYRPKVQINNRIGSPKLLLSLSG